MNKNLICKIDQTSSIYEIEIKDGLLSNLDIDFFSTLGSRFAIITDSTIASLYGDQLKDSFLKHSLEAFLFSFPSGENSKTRHTKVILEDQMFDAGIGRDTCLIALGGGVATDLGGYIAATYCRGLPLVMIPTSLLCMVDASIGGKTGVDVPHGKNLIGSIYQPKKVMIDPSLLKTLPLNEVKNGVVEMIKHAIIADQAYFDFLEDNFKQILSLTPETIEKAIFESCRIKKEIVELDEKEGGKRHLLNFGHTIGHALENLSNYVLSHGEAVAIGMLVEGHLAVQLGHLKQNTFDRIHKVLKTYSLPLRLEKRFPASEIMEAMQMDKKSLKGLPRFVIIDSIGSPLIFEGNYSHHVDEILLNNALQWMNDDLCCH